VGTQNSGHSHTLLSDTAYGNGEGECVTRRRNFNVRIKSEPENSDKECRVFDKCQNINNKLAENGSDECNSKGSGRARRKFSKRYPCKFCKKLLGGSYIKLHMMKHLGTLPHVCKICAQQFAFISNLKVHLRSKHGFE
jgi:hypothetical protein